LVKDKGQSKTQNSKLKTQNSHPNPPMPILTLNLDTVQLTDDQFYELCQRNQDWQFELSSIGELIVMAPVGGDSGNQEADLNGYVWSWNRQTQLGYVFSSSTIFKLPNGANRSPDVAWNQEPRRKRTGYGSRFAPEYQIRIASPKASPQSGGEYIPYSIQKERWEALTPDQRRRFPPLAPDFGLSCDLPRIVWHPCKPKCRNTSAVEYGWVG
jgi:hypothetical protein